MKDANMYIHMANKTYYPDTVFPIHLSNFEFSFIIYEHYSALNISFM